MASDSRLACFIVVFALHVGNRSGRRATFGGMILRPAPISLHMASSTEKHGKEGDFVTHRRCTTSGCLPVGKPPAHRPRALPAPETGATYIQCKRAADMGARLARSHEAFLRLTRPSFNSPVNNTWHFGPSHRRCRWGTSFADRKADFGVDVPIPMRARDGAHHKKINNPGERVSRRRREPFPRSAHSTARQLTPRLQVRHPHGSSCTAHADSSFTPRGVFELKFLG
jgi:hypothetical protein